MTSQRLVSDTFTLSGELLDRVRQALEIAANQIRVAEGGGYGRHVDDALIQAEEAINAQAVLLQDALDDDRAEAEELDSVTRQSWFPRYRAA